jgi:hypothetical protein
LAAIEQTVMSLRLFSHRFSSLSTLVGTIKALLTALPLWAHSKRYSSTPWQHSLEEYFIRSFPPSHTSLVLRISGSRNSLMLCREQYYYVPRHNIRDFTFTPVSELTYCDK